MMKCDVGDIVQSQAGRDRDQFFIVSSILGDEYVYLVDGKNKKLNNPKKKKIKHLIVRKQKSELKEKFEQSQYLLGSEIRKVLQNFKINM